MLFNVKKYCDKKKEIKTIYFYKFVYIFYFYKKIMFNRIYKQSEYFYKPFYFLHFMKMLFNV